VAKVEFFNALNTGKLLGHLVTLKYGAEVQPVIAKDVQFHPVTDAPVHFDLYRVAQNQTIRISVPVHFRNYEASPGLKRGGALNINRHELELMAPADRIPEEVVIDLTGLEIGDSMRAGDVVLPEGISLAIPRESTVASIATSSAMQSEEAEVAEGDGGEATPDA
jgi:large subunit ribosomal protein L25